MMNSMFNIIKKYKALILIFFAILSFAMLVPQSTHAFIGTGIFDYFDSALGAIEETSGPVVESFFVVLVLYCVGWITMSLSSIGVDYLLQDPNNLLSLGGNEIVIAGWNFTSGLANLIIIVLFVVVALSYIMKWNKFEPKKAIIRLIVAALLVNFSFLFCQILVDVSNILMDSFTNFTAEDGKIAGALVKQAMTASGDQIASIITYLVGLTLSGMTVVLGPVVQAGAVTLLGVMLLPNVLTFFVQLGISFILSSVFFIYFTVLLLRIAVVQIFTIISPLAVLCFVLPQTKKMGEQWLNSLIHWSMFTVPLTFFLMLATYILKKPAEMSLAGLGKEAGGFIFFNLDDLGTMFATYFLLAIFLIMALIISKKMVPKEVTEIVNEAKSQSKYFLSPAAKIGKSMGYAVKNDMQKRATGLVARGDALPEMSRDNTLTDNAIRLATRPASIFRKWTKAPTAAEDHAKIVQEEAKAFSDKTSAEDLDNEMNKNIVTGSSRQQLAMISKMTSAEIGKYLAKANAKQEEKLFNLVKTLGDKGTQEKVMKSSIMGDQNDERRLMSLGGPISQGYDTKLEEVIAKSTGEKALDISVKAIENSSAIREAIAKHWTGNEFGARGKKDNEFIGAVNRNYNDFFNNANASLKKYFTSGSCPYCPQPSQPQRQIFSDGTRQTTLSDFAPEPAQGRDAGNQESRGGSGSTGEPGSGRQNRP